MTATQEHPARLLISSSRKPISYLPAAKRLLQEHGEVQLSALGIACSSMVTVAEILKSRNLGKEKHVCTMLERLDDEAQPRQKPKMEVLLVKTAEFDTIIAAEKDTAATEAADRAAAGAKAEVVKADKAAAPQEEDEVPTTAAAEAVDALTDEVGQQAAEEAAAA